MIIALKYQWTISILVSLIFLYNSVNCATVADLDFGYHNYASITSILKSYAAAYPDKTYLYSIGKSVQNRELWVLAIADSNPSIHVPLRPEAKYIGNMHGNEVPSKEILFHLIDYMLKNQKNDAKVDFIMKNTRVHILLSMNPDGFEISRNGDCSSVNGRYNARGYDLNRNFPDYFECNSYPIQPETQSVINWLNKNQFVLSANLHGGSVVANYPFDNVKNYRGNPIYSPTMDDDIFRNISKTYSFNHANMKSSPCGIEQFKDGITNGAYWYPVMGGMQDFNYWRFGCKEITLEVSCCKYPPASQLPQLWDDNKNALISYLMLANTGVRGIVSFANGKLATNVTVNINSREPYFKTNSYGEYYRILLPGTYSLSIMLNCTSIYKTTIVIPSSGLLQYSITLPNNLYTLYQNSLSKLNKYGVFCSVNKSPNACSLKTLTSINSRDLDIISADSSAESLKSNSLIFVIIASFFYLI